jgi:hypothetical protein
MWCAGSSLRGRVVMLAALTCVTCRETSSNSFAPSSGDAATTSAESPLFDGGAASRAIGLGDLTPGFGPGWSRPQPCDVHPLQPTVTLRQVGADDWVRKDLAPLIRARVDRRLKDVRRCYVRELGSRPGLCGQVVVYAEGRLSDGIAKLTVNPSSTKDRALAACSVEALSGSLNGLPFSSSKHRSRHARTFDFDVVLDFSVP